MPRHDARHELLDAAERLFAVHGIPNVSDRRIAEAAANTNHSAVRYYFGGRPGLLRALLDRHQDALEPERARLFAESDSLLGDIRALVLPLTTLYAELPIPSWRARFLDQAQHDPTTADLVREVGAVHAPAAKEIVGSVVDRLAHLDRAVVEGRATLMVHIVSSACAEIEGRAERSGEQPPWSQTGTFLCDAIAGMLQAPITR